MHISPFHTSAHLSCSVYISIQYLIHVSIPPFMSRSRHRHGSAGQGRSPPVSRQLVRLPRLHREGVLSWVMLITMIIRVKICPPLHFTWNGIRIQYFYFSIIESEVNSVPYRPAAMRHGPSAAAGSHFNFSYRRAWTTGQRSIHYEYVRSYTFHDFLYTNIL